jgi:hypothetical protein
MWKSIVVGQLFVLQEGSAVGWMMKESSISFLQRKVFSHLQSIQTTSEPSPQSYSLCTQGKAAVPGSKPLTSVWC